MATHFLLTAAARTLSLRDIYKGGEEAAFETFCQIRWADNDGKPVCPKCGCVEAFNIKTRRKFKCKGCHHQFSPQHLHQYAAHAAWAEDHRREDNGQLCRRALGLALAHPVSRDWKGYWQKSAG